MWYDPKEHSYEESPGLEFESQDRYLLTVWL